LGWHVVGSQSRYDPVAAAFAPLASARLRPSGYAGRALPLFRATAPRIAEGEAR
jgi:hypothetical protein